MRKNMYPSILLLLTVCACSSSHGSLPEQEAVQETCEAGSELDASSPVMDATCPFVRVDSFSPLVMNASSGGLLTLTGCSFSRVIDVQVNVVSVPFTVLDDARLVVQVPPLATTYAAPFETEVDVLVTPGEQAQAHVRQE